MLSSLLWSIHNIFLTSMVPVLKFFGTLRTNATNSCQISVSLHIQYIYSALYLFYTTLRAKPTAVKRVVFPQLLLRNGMGVVDVGSVTYLYL